MKLVSWNVNGLRACLTKGFVESVESLDADCICLQETKLQAGQVDLALEGYESYWHYAEKKGYSGTAIFTRVAPLGVSYGIGLDWADAEGRAVTLEFADFYLVTVYSPNSQDLLRRLPLRLEWEAALLEYLLRLERMKPVVLCGDLNVAHQEIDLKNPQSNHQNAGFSDEERAAFTRLLDAGHVDTFRHFYPTLTEAYSWWSYRFQARARNTGWRIDYFVCSEALRPRLADAQIHSDVLGSDHCPVSLTLND